jgi:hypothetical protein
LLHDGLPHRVGHGIAPSRFIVAQGLAFVGSSWTAQRERGHKDVSATMIYTQVMKKPGVGVKSPFDLL